MAKIFFITCVVLASIATITAIAVPQDDGAHQILDIETPQVFNYNSPLKQPDSLRSRPYFDFLSTLYRHDKAKNDLFRPYQRQLRTVAINPVSRTRPRSKRAIVFRPLFVYKQQEIKKQEYQERKRRRRY